MAAGRRIADEAEARRCIRAAERAGQRAGEWARAHGVDGRSLRAWRLNLERRQTLAVAKRRAPKVRPPVASALVELIPRQPASGTHARYLLEVGGARLAFGDDVSADTLRRVLQALRSC